VAWSIAASQGSLSQLSYIAETMQNTEMFYCGDKLDWRVANEDFIASRKCVGMVGYWFQISSFSAFAVVQDHVLLSQNAICCSAGLIEIEQHWRDKNYFTRHTPTDRLSIFYVYDVTMRCIKRVASIYIYIYIYIRSLLYMFNLYRFKMPECVGDLILAKSWRKQGRICW